MEYKVVVSAISECGTYVDRLTSHVMTKAETPQSAILQVLGISAEALTWYSLTFRQQVTNPNTKPIIIGYEVEY